MESQEPKRRYFKPVKKVSEMTDEELTHFAEFVFSSMSGVHDDEDQEVVEIDFGNLDEDPVNADWIKHVGKNRKPGSKH
jgi:hypothetical protein